MKNENKLLSLFLAAVLLINTVIGSGMLVSTVFASTKSSDSKITDFVTSKVDIDGLLASKYTENIPLGYNDSIFSFYQPGWGFDESRIHFNLTPVSTTSLDHDLMINCGWSMPVTVTADGTAVTVSDADFIPSYVTSKGGDELSVIGYKYVAQNNLIAVIIEATNNSDSPVSVTVNASLGGAVKDVVASDGALSATYYRDTVNILDIRAEGDGFADDGNTLIKTATVDVGETVTFRVAASFDRELASESTLDAFFADGDPLNTQKTTYNAWFTDNIPYIDVPDADIQRIYYYRWHTYRSQIRLTLDGTYVITEFLPNVSWARSHNSIVCAAGHHIYEGRWLRNSVYISDYMNHWFSDGIDAVYLYSSWLADAYYQSYLASGDESITNYLDDLVNYYVHFNSNGARFDSTLGLYRMNGGSEGMECSVSDPNNSYNSFRATFNSYMYANALAIAELAKLKGDTALYDEYVAKADALQSAIETIWDDKDNFYKALHTPDGALVDVREQYGLVPWMFNMPVDDVEHSSAWNDFMNPETGFYAQYGPLTAEREYAKDSIINTCHWDGPSWPFATTQTLIAMSNLINNYETNTAITAEDYFTILQNYAKSHYKDADGDGIRETPWIGENLDAYTGEWIQNRQRSSYYNHSQFANLIITGLIGVKPDSDNTLDIEPLVPSDWNYFCLENLPYHGHNVTVIYDKDGSHYGADAGLTVYVDGEKKANENGVKAMSVDIGDIPEKSDAYNELLNLYNANVNRSESDYSEGFDALKNALANARLVIFDRSSTDAECKAAANAIKTALIGLKRSTVYRIEAESGVLGGSHVGNNASASGGSYVAGLGGTSTSERNAYVLMTVNMPKAGVYDMKLAVKSSTQWAASTGSGHNLSINGGTPVTLSYPVVDEFIVQRVSVALNEGENTIKISGIPGSSAWAYIDYIEFNLTNNTVKLEAELGTLGGVASIGSRDDASGGKFVGNLGGSSDEQKSYVILNVTAPQAGRYKMNLVVKSSTQYAATSGSANNLAINGGTPVTVWYPVSDTFISHAVIVELKEGNNEIKISGVPGSGAWAQVDYIEVDFSASAERYEAENGVFNGNAYKNNNADASSGVYVSGIGGASTSEQNVSVTMTVNVPKAGVYPISIRTRVNPIYVSDAGSGHNLTVNGGTPVTLAYPISANFFYFDTYVTLKAGANTIKISGIPGSGAWGFLDCIDIFTPVTTDVNDFTALKSVYYANVDTYNGDYCLNEQGIAFKNAFKNAETVLCEPMSLQSDIDNAAKALSDASVALVGNTEHTPADSYEFDEHGHWLECAVCEKILISYAEHKGGEATCQNGAECQFCGYEYTEKNPENHIDNEGIWTNGDGTHSFDRECCDESDIATEGCTYGEDNVCDKCGYDCTIDIAEDNVVNAFENIFKGGENEVEAVGPDGAMSDDYKVIKPADIDGFKYVMFNLHFDENGKVFLRHHFIITGDVTITLNGEAVELKNDGCSANVYYIDAAPEAGKYHVADTITVNVTTEIKASLYSYIKVALESGTLSEKQETLLKALYDLNEAMK